MQRQCMAALGSQLVTLGASQASDAAFFWAQENIASFDVQLSEDALADIDRVYRRYRDPAFN